MKNSNKYNSLLEEFNVFAKGKIDQTDESPNCLVYTRVSSKDQFDSNNSIETQNRLCKQYAQHHNLKIIETFGSTYESAKTDSNRKEFQRMMDFIKKNSKLKIKKILVYTLDRFSRTGTSAITLAERLYKEHNIKVVSISDPTDTDSVYGQYMQNIKFLNSNLDNGLRRIRCIQGMKDAMLRGEWPNALPIGYTSIRTNGQRKIVINSKGKILKNAFIWKGEEGISSEEIKIRLRALGLNITHQTLSRLLRNPLYCGIISHNLLEGEVVEGNHEPLISKELFKKVNQNLFKNKHGYSVTKENLNVPLKTFIRCENCSNKMMGYVVKKKNLWYYKCNIIGCKNNISAKFIHNEFRYIVSTYQIDLSDNLRAKLKTNIINRFSDFIGNIQKREMILKANLTELEKDKENLVDMFIKGKIDEDTYKKSKDRYDDKINEIMQQMNSPQIEMSNLETMIENTLKYSSNLLKMWDNGDYQLKRNLQEFLFPQGIIFNKQNTTCRTPEISLLINYICCESKASESKKKDETIVEYNFARLVELQGIEPWSGVGNDGAFYMFIGNYCRVCEGLSNTDLTPYVTL